MWCLTVPYPNPIHRADENMFFPTMTKKAVTKRAGAVPATLMTVWALLLLQGCVDRKPQALGRRLFEIDTLGPARSCTVPRIATLTDGAEAPVTMSVVNDGGWCPVTVARDQGALSANSPFDAGLLTTRPSHGSVYIHSVGQYTRMDYTPSRAYAGPDQFAVTLLPGATVLRVAVTVAPGVQPPPVAQAPEAAAPASSRRRTPAKKATTR